MPLLLSAIATIISIGSLLLAFRNFRKSQRLEFLQRRDQLLHKVSDLNGELSEGRLISARFQIVLINKMSSPAMDATHAEELKSQIARIEALRGNLEMVANHWDQTLQQLHSACSNLTMATDPAIVEHLITSVQIASDDIKQTNGVHLASLHTLETTDPMLRASVDKVHELKIRQAELNVQESIKNIERG